MERERHRKRHELEHLDKDDLYYEINKTFKGQIPSDVREALEAELNKHNENLNTSEPVKEFFQGKE